ncbi:MAG: LLM class flavin-dependent oxidoreductase, partial [Yaniella sp.]|nr:LLM class flavin-dependent oxidoreductase [Yaniella sp.]
MTNFAPTPNPSNHHAASLDEGVVEFGLHTFGDLTQDVEGTRVLSYPEVLRNVVAEGVLADEVGIDVIGIGEHHRPDYAISAPDVVLTGIGAQTERIKLI